MRMCLVCARARMLACCEYVSCVADVKGWVGVCVRVSVYLHDSRANMSAMRACMETEVARICGRGCLVGGIGECVLLNIYIYVQNLGIRS